MKWLVPCLLLFGGGSQSLNLGNMTCADPGMANMLSALGRWKQCPQWTHPSLPLLPRQWTLLALDMGKLGSNLLTPEHPGQVDQRCLKREPRSEDWWHVSIQHSWRKWRNMVSGP
ncbi:hypothetical protein OS493_014481 [Desmophyllum pertusum]|uniref:Uncharacterized protein n=1 Tax=Desmophyllum pertusum TaxID=174260 RepID=A0A9X0CMY5_9CNID|nr:hypothetical protein OS493_014481 [Desmophyllum pertusum]